MSQRIAGSARVRGGKKLIPDGYRKQGSRNQVLGIDLQPFASMRRSLLRAPLHLTSGDLEA